MAPTLRQRQSVISAALAPIATQLPANTSVLRLAAVCRSAFLLFVRQSDNWGKGELADWLTNHYAKATCLDEEPAPSERKPSQSVQPHALQLLMRKARIEVIQGVEELLEHREDAPFLAPRVSRLRRAGSRRGGRQRVRTHQGVRDDARGLRAVASRGRLPDVATAVCFESSLRSLEGEPD